MKTKQRKKSTRSMGTHTHGRGFKKKARGKGHRGGIGMAGTGKRADHKKATVINLFGSKYFGKSKTLRKAIPIRFETINLRDIEDKFNSLLKKGTIKEASKGKYEADFDGYKILGLGNITRKIKIVASSASQSAIDKVKKAGGDIELSEEIPDAKDSE